jgi:cob(I)alamin adenosyltransferase
MADLKQRKQATDLKRAQSTLFAYEATFLSKSGAQRPPEMSTTHVLSMLRTRIVQLEKEQAELAAQKMVSVKPSCTSEQTGKAAIGPHVPVPPVPPLSSSPQPGDTLQLLQ